MWVKVVGNSMAPKHKVHLAAIQIAFSGLRQHSIPPTKAYRLVRF